MFSKVNRVNTTKFKEILSKGRVVHSENFYTRFLRDDLVKEFSVVVPKKIIKGAVKRNILKRKIKSLIRKEMGMFLGGSYIIFIKNWPDNFKQEDIKSEISKLASLTKGY